ncbi:aminoglycoside phosphotransferase family protein [Cytobacillus horneckiae]|uniref:phosphotransferase family protein n=1 Tax=Cytobacillus horneckiae TaxID=549687 RepID=UPI0039A0FD77
MQPIYINEIPNEIKQYVTEVLSIRFPRQGYTSDVGIIENAGNVFVLKRTKEPLYSSWLSQEVSVSNCLSEKTNLPVPKVKKFVAERGKDHAWALFEFLEGDTLRTALNKEKNKEKRNELIFNFGKILSRIHSMPCPKELLHDKCWIDEMLFNAEYNLKHYKVDGTEEILKNMKMNKPSKIKQTFIHGDFTIDNVLVHNGKVTGVIDWAGGTYGDPRYDVSIAIRPKPNAFNNEIDREIFYEGYGEKMIDDKTYDYFVNGLYEFF